MTKNIPTYTIKLPSYTVLSEPNHLAVGKAVDDLLRQYFLGQKVVVRGLSSQEHPSMNAGQLIEIIKRQGTDRYDMTRTGDRYENVDGKHIDLFAFRRIVSERMQLFRYMSWGFYHGSIAIHGAPTRLDILIVYDALKLKAVQHRYEGREDNKRDGFVFKDPAHKSDALFAVIHLK